MIDGLGERIRVRRTEAGLTQEELSEMSGLSVRTISDIERGLTSRPRRSTLALLEAALGLPGRDPPRPGCASRPLRPRQLPPPVQHFVARTAELKELSRLLDEAERAGGTVVISAIGGTAGVGKTALALHWAHQVAVRFPGGQLYVNLRGYDPDRPVPSAEALAGFLRALGVPGHDIPLELDERAARYRTMLAGRRMLVVLDNAGSVEQVRPLLPGTPGCAAVVTSRDALAGLVARNGAARLDLDLLPLADAVRLLHALIGSRVDADPRVAKQLATQCCRLPLALRVAAELAAARPAISLTDLTSELDDQQRRLELLDADGDTRTGVRAVFSWSHGNLDPGAARAFRLLALHPGPDFDPYAATALTATPAEHARRLLDVLARAHLIQPTAPGRYGMHDLLRAYAGELAATLDAVDERHAALTRLYDHYLHTASVAMDTLYPDERHRRPRVAPPAAPAPPVTCPAAARAWLDTEQSTVVSVTAHAAGHGWPAHATRLAATLLRYLELGGHYSEAITIHGHARAAARRIGDRVAEAVAANAMGSADLHQGRCQQAADSFEQALVLLRAVGDQVGEARALCSLGNANFQLGHFRQAADQYQQSLVLYDKVGERFGEALVLSNLGNVEVLQGRYQQAAAHLQRALTLDRMIGSRQNECHALSNLGLVWLRQGRYRQATDHFRQALALFRETGDRYGEAEALSRLGLVWLRQGRYRRATGHFQQALELARETGERPGEADALNSLGEVLLATGQPGHALGQHIAALSLADRIGDKFQQARAHDGLGHAYHATGGPGKARSHWQNALALYTDLGTPEADRLRAQLATAD